MCASVYEVTHCEPFVVSDDVAVLSLIQAYTVDSIGMPSVIIYFLGGPSVFLPVFYAVLSMIVYFFQSEYFLSTTFVAEMKIVLGL